MPVKTNQFHLKKYHHNSSYGIFNRGAQNEAILEKLRYFLHKNQIIAYKTYRSGYCFLAIAFEKELSLKTIQNLVIQFELENKLHQRKTSVFPSPKAKKFRINQYIVKWDIQKQSMLVIGHKDSTEGDPDNKGDDFHLDQLRIQLKYYHPDCEIRLSRGIDSKMKPSLLILYPAKLDGKKIRRRLYEILGRYQSKKKKFVP